MPTLNEIAAKAGAKDVQRVVAGIAMAVLRFGEDPFTMIECLRRNQPDLFRKIKPREVSKRERNSYL